MKRSFPLLFLLGLSILSGSACAQATGGSVTPAASAKERAPQVNLAKCLPAGIKLTDVVEVTSVEGAHRKPGGSRNVTVEQKLNYLKASCNSENKLVDGSGRQIVFYHLIGCWGYPPPDYRELLQKQRHEIARLKQDHTVIEMTCNPSGVHIP